MQAPFPAVDEEVARLPGPDTILPRAFHARDALAVALDLVGKRLRHGDVLVEICEVEAYRGPSDSASHARSGKTPRNAVMWGPPGRAYVYLCYGLHQMLNVVCQPEGEAHAVLIRAARVLAGEEIVRARRGDRPAVELANGPGKLAAALAVDRRHDGEDFAAPGGLELHDGPSVPLVAGPRVGIAFARDEDVRAPWRVATAGSPFVSRGGVLDRATAARLRRRHRPWR